MVLERKRIRVSVREDTPIFKDFKKFMQNIDNKTELFMLMADILSKEVDPSIVTIICTRLSKITSNIVVDKSHLEPCNHEATQGYFFMLKMQ